MPILDLSQESIKLKIWSTIKARTIPYIEWLFFPSKCAKQKALFSTVKKKQLIYFISRDKATRKSSLWNASALKEDLSSIVSDLKP